MLPDDGADECGIQVTGIAVPLQLIAELQNIRKFMVGLIN